MVSETASSLLREKLRCESQNRVALEKTILDLRAGLQARDKEHAAAQAQWEKEAEASRAREAESDARERDLQTTILSRESNSKAAVDEAAEQIRQLQGMLAREQETVEELRVDLAKAEARESAAKSREEAGQRELVKQVSALRKVEEERDSLKRALETAEQRPSRKVTFMEGTAEKATKKRFVKTPARAPVSPSSDATSDESSSSSTPSPRRSVRLSRKSLTTPKPTPRRSSARKSIGKTPKSTSKKQPLSGRARLSAVKADLEDLGARRSARVQGAEPELAELPASVRKPRKKLVFESPSSLPSSASPADARPARPRVSLTLPAISPPSSPGSASDSPVSFFHKVKSFFAPNDDE